MSPTIIDLTAPDLGESKNDSQDGSDQMLQDVLRAAHRDRLYRTLYLLCHDNDIARRVKGILLIEEDKVQSKVFKEMRALSEGEDDEKSDSEADDDQDESEALPSANDVKVTKQGHTANTKNDGKDDVSGQISAGVKRLRSRYATCSNCLEEFDVTQNGKIDCVWHPGYREVDDESSTWYDWDEDCHGRMDDQEDEYPEGFIWTCCEQSGDCDGCQTGPHAEESLSSKRARY